MHCNSIIQKICQTHKNTIKKTAALLSYPKLFDNLHLCQHYWIFLTKFEKYLDHLYDEDTEMTSTWSKKKDCPVQSIPDANIIEAFFGRSTLTQFLRKESVLLFRLLCVHQLQRPGHNDNSPTKRLT